MEGMIVIPFPSQLSTAIEEGKEGKVGKYSLYAQPNQSTG
jgi:hypothetical protein